MSANHPYGQPTQPYRQPTQPYGQPAQQYGQPGYGAPGYGAIPPPKKKTGLIVLIGVLVLLLLGGGATAYWYTQMRYDPAAPIMPGQAKFPQVAVRGYLEALAVGNTVGALSFIADPPAGADFLNDAVLAASLSKNPISIISVTKNDVGTAQNAVVDVVFDIGEARFEFPYHVAKAGDFYFIDNALPTIDAKGLSVPGVGFTLNGVAFTATDGEVPLFPGVYNVVLDNSMLQNMGDSQFVVGNPDKPYLPKLGLGLADGALGAMQDFATAKLKSCMAEKALLTQCGFGYTLPTDEKTKEVLIAKESTIKWRFIGSHKGDFKNDIFTWHQDDPTRATAYISIKVEVAFTATNSYKYDGSRTLTEATVDFSNPADLTIEFKSR